MKDAKKYTNGCVRQLKARKNKPFVGILKYKSGGEWKQVTKTLHGATGKKDAERLLEIWWEDMEARAEINPAVPPKLAKKIVDKTVKQAIEEFLELQYKTKDLEESTYQTQCFYARKHVFPYIGDLVFEKTTWQQIQDWENKLRDILSENSVGICHSLMRKTYKHAYMTQQILQNPFDYVKPPKKLKTPINYLDKAGKKKLQVAIRLKWAVGSPFYTGIYLAYYSGMRSSEICGLRWMDVKLATGIEMMKIEHAIGRKTDGGNYVKTPKNETSARYIPINGQIKEILIKRREQMKKEYAECADNDKPPFKSLYVLGDIKGNYMRVTYLGSTFGKFAKENKINGVLGQPITMHGLRHTFATDAVKHGMDIKSLAAILGHAKADMTLNTYASDDSDAKILAMKKMAEAYEREDEEDW